MTVRIIVATDLDGGIGFKGALPWPRLMNDFKAFKAKTMGQFVVMGRKTFESLPGNLPGRDVIVLSDNAQFHPEGVTTCFDLPEAVNACKPSGQDLWICGGERVYAEGIKIASEIHLTTVAGRFPADTHFPKVNLAEWRMRETEEHHQTKEGLYYTISVYERRDFTR